MIDTILQVIAWLIGSLVLVFTLLLIYALLNVAKSIRYIDDDIFEYEQFKDNHNEKHDFHYADFAGNGKLHDTETMQSEVST